MDKKVEYSEAISSKDKLLRLIPALSEPKLYLLSVIIGYH
jgi:hypothetical protein